MRCRPPRSLEEALAKENGHRSGEALQGQGFQIIGVGPMTGEVVIVGVEVVTSRGQILVEICPRTKADLSVAVVKMNRTKPSRKGTLTTIKF